MTLCPKKSIVLAILYAAWSVNEMWLCGVHFVVQCKCTLDLECQLVRQFCRVYSAQCRAAAEAKVEERVLLHMCTVDMLCVNLRCSFWEFVQFRHVFGKIGKIPRLADLVQCSLVRSKVKSINNITLVEESGHSTEGWPERNRMELGHILDILLRTGRRESDLVILFHSPAAVQCFCWNRHCSYFFCDTQPKFPYWSPWAIGTLSQQSATMIHLLGPLILVHTMLIFFLIVTLLSAVSRMEDELRSLGAEWKTVSPILFHPQLLIIGTSLLAGRLNHCNSFYFRLEEWLSRVCSTPSVVKPE